ncbi:unnamed protein product [Spirodela intermedia]|uniref:Uncharacterized protein n=1 Tax=Spirodela intermedia TaxID=51605 RepID=A0A7I8KAF3_SPIIN|nr:unnamed protein product [Spirodela intermedia]
MKLLTRRLPLHLLPPPLAGPGAGDGVTTRAAAAADVEEEMGIAGSGGG